MLLRHYILKTAVNLEHTIKTRFLRDFNNSKDDGYKLVQMYLDENPSILDDIKRKKGKFVHERPFGQVT